MEAGRVRERLDERAREGEGGGSGRKRNRGKDRQIAS